MIAVARTWLPPSWLRMLAQTLVLAATSIVPPLVVRWMLGEVAQPVSPTDSSSPARSSVAGRTAAGAGIRSPAVRGVTRAVASGAGYQPTLNDIDCQFR